MASGLRIAAEAAAALHTPDCRMAAVEPVCCILVRTEIEMAARVEGGHTVVVRQEGRVVYATGTEMHRREL